MNILIIGASGFIGHNLLAVANKKEYRVFATGRKNLGKNVIPYDICTDDIQMLLSNNELNPNNTWVIICAAISKIDECYEQLDRSTEVNINATKRLMQTLHKLGYKFVFISSDAVYNGSKTYYTELDKTTAQSVYGKQKAEIEEWILSNMPDNLIARISIVLDTINRKNNILSEFDQKIKNGETIYCMEDRLFCPTYIGDVSNIILNCLEQNVNGLFNVANSEIFSRKELAQYFSKCRGIEAKVEEKSKEWFSFKDERHTKTCLINKKIEKTIGYKFQSVQQTIEQYCINNPNIEVER